MTRKSPKSDVMGDVVADHMSEIKRMTVNFPLNGTTFDPDDLKKNLSRLTEPVSLEQIKRAASASLPNNGMSGISTDKADGKITQESFDRLSLALVNAIESALSDLNLDKDDTAVAQLTSMCIRLGILKNETSNRKKHYHAVKRVKVSDQAFRNSTSGRTEYNNKRSANAKVWQALVTDFISAYNPKEFFQMTRTRQASIVLKELKSKKFDLGKETIANFLRKIDK